VTELAKILSIHPSTCSNMLDKLQRKGLVRRDRSLTDQRNVHLYPTEKGEDVLRTAPRPFEGVLAHGLMRLADDDLRYLEIGLGNFIEALAVQDKSDGLKPIE
jgi:DNA-binding MarR family transcriptional regulator